MHYQLFMLLISMYVAGSEGLVFCDCINPFIGSETVFGVPKRLCKDTGKCYVPCEADCRDLEPSSFPGQCRSEVACHGSVLFEPRLPDSPQPQLLDILQPAISCQCINPGTEDGQEEDPEISCSFEGSQICYIDHFLDDCFDKTLARGENRSTSLFACTLFLKNKLDEKYAENVQSAMENGKMKKDKNGTNEEEIQAEKEERKGRAFPDLLGLSRNVAPDQKPAQPQEKDLLKMEKPREVEYYRVPGYGGGLNPKYRAAIPVSTPKGGFDPRYQAADVPQTGFDPRYQAADVPQTGFDPRYEAADVPQTGFDPRYQAADVSQTGFDPRYEAADVPQTGFDPRYQAADVPQTGFDPRYEAADASQGGFYSVDEATVVIPNKK